MEIRVDVSEAFRYMGGRGKPEGRDLEELNKAAELIGNTVNPRSVERICVIIRPGNPGEKPGQEQSQEQSQEQNQEQSQEQSQEQNRKQGLLLAGTGLVLSGAAVQVLLRDCKECVIFCATLGAEVEALTRRWEIKDIAFAAALDACASSAVESLCNAVEEKIQQQLPASSGPVFLTERFSPGYEDMPLSLQRDFCTTLDTVRRLGVSLSESGLMIPRKSVTAVFGIADREQKKRESGCGHCPAFGGCSFRESGITCYGHIL